MKKLFSTTALCALAATGYAQTAIKAGTVQLGGSVGYSQQTADRAYSYYTGSNYLNTTQYVTNKTFFLNPMAGYFVADNLAVGISFAQTINKTTYSYDTSFLAGDEQRTKQLSLGAFVQYYYMLTDQFGLAGTLGAGYSHSTQNAVYGNGPAASSTGNGFSAALTPSIVFFPVPKFSLGASIGNLSYSQESRKSTNANTAYNNETTKSSLFGASFGLSYLAFSGNYYIGH